MDNMLRKQQQQHSNGMSGKSRAEGLAIHRDSRVIAKIQPKIRIIHIFAPEIIQTDVANFRELVQRLTGKPSSTATATTTASKTAKARKQLPASRSQLDAHHDNHGKMVSDDHINNNNNYLYKPAAAAAVVFGRNNKDYEGGDEDHGGFLDAFDSVDCTFMEQLGQFPLEPQNHHNHHLNPFGHNPFSYNRG